MNERLRIGDAERETAAHELGEHFAMGRITAEEHSERLEQIWSARTVGRPGTGVRGPPAAAEAEPVRATPRREWSGRASARRVPFPVKLLIALVVVVLVFTHLPFILVGLLVYVVFLRRFVHHRRPRHTRWR